MAAPNSSFFTSDPIHGYAAPAPNTSVFAADAVHQAAMGASGGMSRAPGAPSTQQAALMAPPSPQVNSMTHPAMQGAPMPLQEPAMTAPPPLPVGPPPSVMAPTPLPVGPPPSMMAPPPMMAPQPPKPQAGTMMALQFLQAADMIARLPLPAALPTPKRQRPEYFDGPFGPQMTGYEQGMAACDKLVGVPYGPYIHNEMPSGGSYERPLPSNPSNTLYVNGLPTNCTRRELTHIFRRFTGFCDVRLVNRGFNNRHVIAFVDFDTPAQAFSAMESLQGYMFDIHEPYTHKLHLQFSSPGPRLGGASRGRR